MKDIMKAAMAAAAISAILAGCANKETIIGNSRKKAEPVPVKVMTVSRTAALSSTSYVGRVEPSKSAVVLNEFPGTLEEMRAVKGRRISKGDIIATICSETVKSAYDIAKATLDQAEDGYARAEKVYGSGSVTEVKMVEIRTQLEQARAAEKAARQALEDCSIKAPFSGVVGEVYVQKGEHVSAATPLVQILDVESIEIHFSVPESEYSSISAGDTAAIEIPALNRNVEGVIAVKGISASALSHAYDFTIKSISDAKSLMPGMVCKIRLQSEGGESIIIPTSAVMTDMQGRYIWGVTPDDKVCKTYVTVGGYADKGVIISEGLEEGGRVIVEGSRKVSTGMDVKAEEK